MTASLAITLWCDAKFCDKHITVKADRKAQAREEAEREHGWVSAGPGSDFCCAVHRKGIPKTAEVQAALGRLQRKFDTPRDRLVLLTAKLPCHCGHPFRDHLSLYGCGSTCDCRQLGIAS